MKTVKRIIRGFGDLPGMGYHPGVSVFVLLIALGSIGAGWLGGILMVVVFGPMLCWGAYERARDAERRTDR